MDTAFFSSGSKLEEVTMLNAPVTNVPRTATYKMPAILTKSPAVAFLTASSANARATVVQADTAKQPTFLLDKHNKYYYDITLAQSLVSEGNISARSLGGATGTTTSFMFVFTPEVYINNTQFMWGTESSAKRLSVPFLFI
jgi:hypothetical protein